MTYVYRKTLIFCEQRECTSFLCNSYPAEFTENGKRFLTIDHYLAYRKAVLAKDKRLADII